MDPVTNIAVDSSDNCGNENVGKVNNGLCDVIVVHGFIAVI